MTAARKGQGKSSSPIAGTVPLREAARVWLVHHSTVRRWVREGAVASVVTASRRVYIPLAEVERLMPRKGAKP